MSTAFPYLEIPDGLRHIVGKPDTGTRMYRREGSDEECGPWFDALSAAFPSDYFVSPGGVSMYAPVSRAGVHKRLKEGKLTMFLFHVVQSKRNLFGYQKKLKHLPYGYIPVSECKAWSKELETRPQRQRTEEAQGDGDFEGKFLAKDPDDTNKKSVRYEHEEITAEKIKLLVEVVAEETMSRLLPGKFRQKRTEKKEEKMRVTRQAAKRKHNE